MAYVSSIDGIEIYYEVVGDGEVTLIPISGWGAQTSAEHWKYQLSFSSDYKLVLIDLPGHGKSGNTRETYTMQSYGQDVKSIVERLNIENLILIGHSMGGAVILEAAKLLSSRILGLIMVDSLAGNLYVRMEAAEIKEILTPFEENFERTFLNLLEPMLSDKFNPQDVNQLKNSIPHLDKRSLISALTELCKWDMNDVLPEITRPIKCICAGRTFPPEIRDVYNRVFDALYIEEVGHLLIYEDPSRFNKVFSELLEDIK